MTDVLPRINVTDAKNDVTRPASASPATSPIKSSHAPTASRSRPSSRIGRAAGRTSVDEQASGSLGPTSKPESQHPYDPLSQEILQRTSGHSPAQSRQRRPSESLSRPLTGADGDNAESNAATPKDKRKGVSFLARFMGNKKKDEADQEKSELEAEEKDTRPEGADAEIFHEPLDNLGFSPEHLPPPAYIKVRSRNKNAREFNRVFCAQALGVDTPKKHTDEGLSSRIRDISKPEEAAVWALEFSKDGRYLASTGQDGSINIWSVLANREDRRSHEMEEEAKVEGGHASVRLSAPVFRSKPTRVYEGHTAPVLDLSWSKNNFLLSCSMDKTVRLWHVSQNECLCVFKHNDVVTSIHFHPKDDRFFLAGSLDSRLRLWSIPDKTVAFHVAVSEIITAVTFTPDGRTAIAGCVTGLCAFFDTEQLKLQTSIIVKSAHGKNAKGSKITGLETINIPPGSSNVKLLVTSNDSRVRLYNVRDKSLEMKFKGNENNSSQIRARFSDDGRYITCGSEDKKMFIWSTSQPENERRNKWPLEMFEAHSHVATAAVLAPVKARMLLSASEDPVYDLCNPPPVTLVSTSEVESMASPQEANSDANSIQPTPATAEGGSSFRRPFESPAYLNRSTHRNGNILITADATGNIKVFRQDCAWDKRNIDPFQTSAHRTVRVGSNLIRRASLATQSSSRRSRQNSIKSQAPSERILSWRQSIVSTSSLERKPSLTMAAASALTRNRSNASARRNESRSALRSSSRRSSAIASPVVASTPPSDRDAEPSRPSLAGTRKSSVDTAASASQASFQRPGAPVMQRGSSNVSVTSSQYWRSNAWQDDIIDQLQHAQVSNRSPALGVPVDSRKHSAAGSRANSSTALADMSQLEVKMSRVSQLTSNGVDQDTGDEKDTNKDSRGRDAGDGGIRCQRCNGQDFRARARALGGTPRFSCTRCGLTVAAV